MLARVLVLAFFAAAATAAQPESLESSELWSFLAQVVRAKQGTPARPLPPAVPASAITAPAPAVAAPAETSRNLTKVDVAIWGSPSCAGTSFNFTLPLNQCWAQEDCELVCDGTNVDWNWYAVIDNPNCNGSEYTTAFSFPVAKCVDLISYALMFTCK